jgi:hypothetical protein
MGTALRGQANALLLICTLYLYKNRIQGADVPDA